MSNSGGARHLYQSIWHRAQMKLVTTRRNRSKLAPEYIPGRCNIGRRGRAIRLTTGVVLIGLSIIFEIFALKPSNHLVRLGLAFPFYVGILAFLEGWIRGPEEAGP